MGLFWYLIGEFKMLPSIMIYSKKTVYTKTGKPKAEWSTVIDGKTITAPTKKALQQAIQEMFSII